VRKAEKILELILAKEGNKQKKPQRLYPKCTKPESHNNVIIMD